MCAINQQLTMDSTKKNMRSAHLGHTIYTLQVAILKHQRYIVQLKRQPKTLTQRHYQQCLPHPLNVALNDEVDDFLTLICIS
jgi:hypothetical protein